MQQIDMFDYLEEIERAAASQAATAVPASVSRGRRTWATVRRSASRLGERVWTPIRRAIAWLIKAAPLLFVFQYVNVYTVKRVRTGKTTSYLQYHCLESVLVTRWNADSVVLFLKQQYGKSHRWGNFGVDHWAQDVEVLAEEQRMYGLTFKDHSGLVWC
ncbi:hypothetical protein [Paenibacillus rubinfantis]|uniref:hypothetical protein n=1 Tax=Paenibacillus rubinfantis TaxID=1720296 RepID=UPI00073F2EF2|nr:hypothetical protein [Paenibacillus rubinfantis]